MFLQLLQQVKRVLWDVSMVVQVHAQAAAKVHVTVHAWVAAKVLAKAHVNMDVILHAGHHVLQHVALHARAVLMVHNCTEKPNAVNVLYDLLH